MTQEVSYDVITLKLRLTNTLSLIFAHTIIAFCDSMSSAMYIDCREKTVYEHKHCLEKVIIYRCLLYEYMYMYVIYHVLIQCHIFMNKNKQKQIPFIH